MDNKERRDKGRAYVADEAVMQEMTMKISTEIGSISKRIGEERAIELVAKAGFEAWDFSMFSMCNYNWSTGMLEPSSHPLASGSALAYARRLGRIGQDLGIVCNQSHAPFPTRVQAIRDKYKLAIECTAEAGGSICVIHPDNYKGANENAEMYLELLPFAKSCGVRIATENMWNWNQELGCASPAACSSHGDFLAHLDAVNDDWFIACLDIGHAEMKGLNTSNRDMIRTLGGKLQALHIHDNDLLHDSHQIPFSMSIDFDTVIKELKAIGYAGDFTLEADRYLGNFDDSQIFEGIKNMCEAARKLRAMFLEA